MLRNCIYADGPFLAVGEPLQGPSENELYAKLHQGMTAHEVVSTFGSPLHKKSERNGSLTMFYHASANQLLDEREGYAGFEIQLVNGRVTGWRILREQPSFRPNTQTPPKWIFCFTGPVSSFCWLVSDSCGVSVAQRHVEVFSRLIDYAILAPKNCQWNSGS
jgi:hypothetical protein